MLRKPVPKPDGFRERDEITYYPRALRTCTLSPRPVLIRLDFRRKLISAEVTSGLSRSLTRPCKKRIARKILDTL
ncbi:hypothetical protein Y032_0005g2372 [Ancylostoma ceylanicum]|uniref:Uncharacterized protein n=1 Tax=Ancylostoma ceylanicum TaxID=53326 RepID=A0A016VRP5_9BILA|nr:hypothetical protein Y032_0005g2372 [Ancylostoma ceylanicum]